MVPLSHRPLIQNSLRLPGLPSSSVIPFHSPHTPAVCPFSAMRCFFLVVIRSYVHEVHFHESDLVVNPNLLPSIKDGDLLEIYQKGEPPERRVVLKVTKRRVASQMLMILLRWKLVLPIHVETNLTSLYVRHLALYRDLCTASESGNTTVEAPGTQEPLCPFYAVKLSRGTLNVTSTTPVVRTYSSRAINRTYLVISAVLLGHPPFARPSCFLSVTCGYSSHTMIHSLGR